MNQSACTMVAAARTILPIESCSRDPIGFDGSFWNLYEYCSGQVLDRFDPSGLQGVNCAALAKDCNDKALSNDEWCKARARPICAIACIRITLNIPGVARGGLVPAACKGLIPALACEEICHAAYEDACNNDTANEAGCCGGALGFCNANGRWPGFIWRLRNGCRTNN